VLMHGGGQTRRSWAAAFGRLATAGYRVIRYDARGHGDSSWSSDGEYSHHARADDLRAVLANTSGDFVLVGASMGGITAMQAVGEGVDATAVILVDIVLAPEKAGIERIRSFMQAHPEGFQDLDAVADAVAAYNPSRPRPQNSEGLRHNLRHGADGRFRWHWDPKILARDADDDLARIDDAVRLFRAGRRVPLLLIRGAQSDVLSDANVGHFLQAFPDAHVLDVAGAGHMVAGDSNDVFTQGILDFLGKYLPVARPSGSAHANRVAGQDPSSQPPRCGYGSGLASCFLCHGLRAFPKLKRGSTERPGVEGVRDVGRFDPMAG
jgi:pimeloyl-ACP methyl ester carboxylesterase